jgi:hypothetical protein
VYPESAEEIHTMAAISLPCVTPKAVKQIPLFPPFSKWDVSEARWIFPRNCLQSFCIETGFPSLEKRGQGRFSELRSEVWFHGISGQSESLDNP